MYTGYYLPNLEPFTFTFRLLLMNFTNCSTFENFPADNFVLISGDFNAQLAPYDAQFIFHSRVVHQWVKSPKKQSDGVHFC